MNPKNALSSMKTDKMHSRVFLYMCTFFYTHTLLTLINMRAPTHNENKSVEFKLIRKRLVIWQVQRSLHRRLYRAYFSKTSYKQKSLDPIFMSPFFVFTVF